MSSENERGNVIKCFTSYRPRFDGCGKDILYDVYSSKSSASTEDSSLKVGAIYLHGAGGNRKHLRSHAEALAACGGAKAFVPDLISLTEEGTAREIWIDHNVRSAQEKNVKQVVEHVKFLKLSRFALVGHSAGGAIALETAIALQASGQPPAVVVLLDAVPWKETIDLAAEFDLKATRLVSLRCEPSMWNKNGIVSEALQRIPRRPSGEDDEGRLVDIKLNEARHGDAIPPFLIGKLCGLFGRGFKPMRDLTLAALCDGLGIATPSSSRSFEQMAVALRAQGDISY